MPTDREGAPLGRGRRHGGHPRRPGQRPLLLRQLPKFRIETNQLKLKDPLTDLGMGIAFTGQADFSGITADQRLMITDVIQKAFVGVDEEGTEAAAATAVMLAGNVPPPPTPVTVDRPFLFFIQDQTGLVLFSGQVVDPNQ